MSLQAGILNLDGKPVSQLFVKQFEAETEQRGLESVQFHLAGPLGMLFRSYHTTQESHLELQPYKTPRGRVLTWDGRLDNRDALMRDLLPDLGVDRTDVAFVVTAYEAWGLEAFAKLTGDWAVTLWDPVEKLLLLARDRAAVRHLYYRMSCESVLWCTDLASLVNMLGQTLTISDEYIAAYLAYWPPAHLTPYREIKAVPPGALVSVHNGKSVTRSYCSSTPAVRIHYKTDSEYEEHFRHVFREAVSRRLRSQSPILAELSGGLDSSAIVCMADDIREKDKVTLPPLDTISMLRTGNSDVDDARYISIVEQQRGKEGVHIELGNSGLMNTLYHSSFVSRPGRLGNGAELETSRSEVMRQGGYRVVLSGIGGDELLGGVPDPTSPLSDLIVGARLFELTKQLLAWSLAKRVPWIQLLLQTVVTMLPAPLRGRLSRKAKVEPWITKSLVRRHHSAITQAFDEVNLWPPSQRAYTQALATLARQLGQFLPGPEERRYPYLDQNLVEFILAIPCEQLIRPGDRRSLMRRALRGLLPSEVLARRTKATGDRYYLRVVEKHWDEIHTIFTDPHTARLGYIDKIEFQRTLRSLKHGQISPRLFQLVKALSLEFWIRNLESRQIVEVPKEESANSIGLLELNAR